MKNNLLKLIGKSMIIVILCFVVAFSIVQIIFIWGVATGLGRDDVVGFSNNKYVIGRPPVSYNLYEKNSGETILDNVIGYKEGKTKSYIKNDIEYVIIDEKKGNYVKNKLGDASKEDMEQLKKIQKLE